MRIALLENDPGENETIFDMWLACYTNEEIGEEIGVSHVTIGSRLEVLKEKFPGTKLTKLSNFEDAGDGFQVPIYNVWTFGKKTNDVAC